MPEVRLTEPVGLIALLNELGMVSSNSEARRLIQQGGVKLDGETLSDLRLELEPSSEPQVLQVGKRKFARLIS